MVWITILETLLLNFCFSFARFAMELCTGPLQFGISTDMTEDYKHSNIFSSLADGKLIFLDHIGSRLNTSLEIQSTKEVVVINFNRVLNAKIAFKCIYTYVSMWDFNTDGAKQNLDISGSGKECNQDLKYVWTIAFSPLIRYSWKIWNTNKGFNKSFVIEWGKRLKKTHGLQSCAFYQWTLLLETTKALLGWETLEYHRWYFVYCIGFTFYVYILQKLYFCSKNNPVNLAQRWTLDSGTDFLEKAASEILSLLQQLTLCALTSP